MSNFAELVKNRRSIRQFTEEKLTAEEVELIMRAALLAPTSRNSRSVNFVLVEDREMLRQLSLSKANYASFIESCALAIVVLFDPIQSTASVEDASIAATYIQMQTEDLGLGSCWCHIIERETASGQDSEQYVRDLLNIPLRFGVLCIIAVGHKERIIKPHEEDHLLWENVHIERFT
jgi:nitroreductase